MPLIARFHVTVDIIDGLVPIDLTIGINGIVTTGDYPIW